MKIMLFCLQVRIFNSGVSGTFFISKLMLNDWVCLKRFGFAYKCPQEKSSPLSFAGELFINC